MWYVIGLWWVSDKDLMDKLFFQLRGVASAVLTSLQHVEQPKAWQAVERELVFPLSGL